jgi:hypothetical protein
VTDLDYPVVCQGELGTTGDPFGSSLVAPLSGMDSKVGLEWLRWCRVLVDDFR